MRHGPPRAFDPPDLDEQDERSRQDVSIPRARIDRRSGRPLYWQIYDAIREDVLSGRLLPGQRLASTRNLAIDLGVSRNTVVLAFELLVAEGYLFSHVGSGTVVAPDLPPELQRSRSSARSNAKEPKSHARISRRVRDLGSLPLFRGPSEPRPFQLGLPALDRMPWDLWGRSVSRALRELSGSRLGYGDPRGALSLRRELSCYLRSLRGLEASPGQIFVVSGSQQALDLSARVLLDPGDEAWIEDPGYLGARAALLAAGARVRPISVDREGLVVPEGLDSAPSARLAYVTPSNQFPTGVTLSLSRRLQLLDWARSHDALVIEDDYDSEYRFSGPPLSPLAALDEDERVIYLGTFSKVLSPALRIGYLVVPTSLVDAFASARYASDRQSPLLEQLSLADFLSSGHFGRHVRRMRVLYRERLRFLEARVQEQLSGRAEIDEGASGLHVTLKLRGSRSDVEVAREAESQGVTVAPISNYLMSAASGHRLVLGYAAFDRKQIAESVERLATILS